VGKNTRIDSDMIGDIAAGAAFLGTGGGGDPYIATLLGREALDRFGPVDLVPLSALEDDAAVFMAAGMGAPTVLIEKLMSLDETDCAVRALERRVGRKATAIIAAEIGGLSAWLGLPAHRQPLPTNSAIPSWSSRNPTRSWKNSLALS
jgi:DUF917 family protein